MAAIKPFASDRIETQFFFVSSDHKLMATRCLKLTVGSLPGPLDSSDRTVHPFSKIVVTVRRESNYPVLDITHIFYLDETGQLCAVTCSTAYDAWPPGWR